MKKLSLTHADARDLLLNLWFNIEPLEQPDKWTYNRVIQTNTRHNYQRDREMYKGIFDIMYNGRKLGRLTTKPHRTIKLVRCYDKYIIYQNILEQAAREVAPGIAVERP